MRQTIREPGTKVALPTGETVSKLQQVRRVQIPGFPAITKPLPDGIQTEDIIKQWPNHLVRICETHFHSIQPVFESRLISWESLGDLNLQQCFGTENTFLLEKALLIPKCVFSGDRFYCR